MGAEVSQVGSDLEYMPTVSDSVKVKNREFLWIFVEKEVPVYEISVDKSPIELMEWFLAQNFSKSDRELLIEYRVFSNFRTTAKKCCDPFDAGVDCVFQVVFGKPVRQGETFG